MKKLSIAAAAIFCALRLCGCGTTTTTQQSTLQSSSTAQNANTSAETQSDPTSSAEDTSSKDESTNSEANTFKVGDTVKTDKWEITVKSITSTDEIRIDYGAYHPDEGEKFVLIELSAKNISKNSETFLPAFVSSKDIKVTLTYQDYNFIASTVPGYKEDLLGTSLNPLSEKTGIVVFKIASDVADKTSELKVVFTENKKTYTITGK